LSPQTQTQNQMLSRLAKKINSKSFPKGKALLAVSGGVDSMVLWAILNELKLPYAIAHFNFQLREAESDADQALVRKVAKAYHAEHHLKIESAENYAEANRLSIQEAARNMRYDWFNELINAAKADYLVTAHHLDDSLETFLINLDRGTGLNGIGGIQDRKGVFRPLLNFTKSQLEEYATQYQIEYREDSSNAKDEYLRNWFRQHLIPLWKQKSPDLLAVMAQNFSHFREAQAINKHYLEMELAKRLSEARQQTFFDCKDWDQLPFPGATLRQWLAQYGFNADQNGQILQSIREDSTGAVFYAANYKLLVDREQLILQVNNETDLEPIRIAEPQRISLPNWNLNIEVIEIDQVDFSFEQTDYFDAAKLEFPLEFRPWRSADRMQPLGMKGQKKISDMLIDQKVSRFDKERLILMCSNSEVAWMLGYRISEAYKVDDSTHKVIRIQWSKQ